MVKNPPANAGDARDMVQSLEWEDPLEEEMEIHSSIVAREIPWTAIQSECAEYTRFASKVPGDMKL